MKKKIFYDIIDEKGRRNYCISFKDFKEEIKQYDEYEITTHVNNKFIVKVFRGIRRK